MAVSKEQWDKAWKILGQFERQELDPKLFKWKYFEEQVGCSKSTLWRGGKEAGYGEGFYTEFERIQTLVKGYKNKGLEYSLKRSKVSTLEAEISKLKQKVKDLEDERDEAREALAYAAMIARRRNIDPEEFTERSPLLKAKSRAKKELNDSLDLNDPTISQFRRKK